ncbi:HET-domain-containing protein [Setomelanomma holmii]|uniref:HET-domain-containing protein n=1 Tax=Setomelanomma holmii TaxID=210430 RepID=A0A9P4GYW9_9PLEO|nr:HET-domain-containing protein [Setomelanomma holmii]
MFSLLPSSRGSNTSYHRSNKASTLLPSRSACTHQHDMLGPESHVYDALPSSTSIRVLVLAPGAANDDISCFLFSCDLDKDHALHPEIPRPIESMCLGMAKGPRAGNDPRRFMLTIDIYFDDDLKTHTHPFQRFNALSYVWGDVADPACISMDGASFWVTRNLFDALKCLRQRDEARTFWIDAICINQTDPDEKKSQIALMRRIYRQAEQVIAFVPQTQEDTESFNTLVGEILQADKKCREVVESGVIPRQLVAEQVEGDKYEEVAGGESSAPGFEVRNLPLQPNGTCIEDYDIPAEDDPAWWAWRRFFASPYFRRIWILQEYALAGDLYIHVGSGQIKADVIMMVMQIVEHKSRLLNANYLGRGENSELARAASLGWMGLERMTMERVFLRHDLYGVGKKIEHKLIDLLANTNLFDATDPRDKVYGLMGLAADGADFTDLIEYQPSVTHANVFLRFAKRLIEKGYLLQILRMACQAPAGTQLPSWVPVSRAKAWTPYGM